MKFTIRLPFTFELIITLIICSLCGLAQGLQCYSCSGAQYCKSVIKNHPQRVGRCDVNDGRCFVRRDPIDDKFWPGVPWRTYGEDCEEDWERGWVHKGKKRPILWCLCDNKDDCNINLGNGTARTTTTASSATVTVTGDNITATQQTTQEPMTATTTPTSQLTTTDTSANGTCPIDFERIAGETSCYKVVSPTLNDVSESRDYTQASTACQSLGAHLSIESIREQRNLANVLRTHPAILQGWQGWWTSGQLVPGTSLFVWRSSNSLVLVDRRLWGFVQSPLRDTCVWIMSISYFNYTLGNYDCSTRGGYICEIDMP